MIRYRNDLDRPLTPDEVDNNFRSVVKLGYIPYFYSIEVDAENENILSDTYICGFKLIGSGNYDEFSLLVDYGGFGETLPVGSKFYGEPSGCQIDFSIDSLGNINYNSTDPESSIGVVINEDNVYLVANHYIHNNNIISYQIQFLGLNPDYIDFNKTVSYSPVVES